MENGLIFDSFNPEFLEIILQILKQRFGNSHFVDSQCAYIHAITQII